MTIETDPLATRAEEMLALARAKGMDVEGGLAQLPAGDQVARVGYLANQLGIDFGVAFDLAVDVAEGRTS